MGKYAYRPEYKKYENFTIPTNPKVLDIANKLFPVIQKGKNLYPGQLNVEKVHFRNCDARILTPKGEKNLPCLVYFHGGAFMIKAAAYHKNLVQKYAKLGHCVVLDVDYRLAPACKFPCQLDDGIEAYNWALDQGFDRIAVGGDSAGGALALGLTRYIVDNNIRVPDYEMLVYPVADSRMISDSMKKYTDTPLWNATLNPIAWDLAVRKEDRHDPIVSALESDNFKGYPKTYIETAEFDCLHDDGTRLYDRLLQDGIPAYLFETKGTIHGFDIEERSPYVQEVVLRRIEHLYEGLHC